MDTPVIDKEISYISKQFRVINAFPLGIMILKDDLTVLAWNTLLSDWTSVAARDIVGSDITRYYPKITRPAYQRKLEKVFAGKETVLLSSKSHGNIFPVSNKKKQRIIQTRVSPIPSSDSTRFHALFTMEDITSISVRMADFKAMRDSAFEEISRRNKIEVELEEKNLLLQGILSSSPIATILVENRTVQWGNDAALKLFCVDNQEEFMGKGTRFFYASNAWYNAMSETVTRLAFEGGKIETDAEFRKANGEIFTGHIMINCIDPKNPFTKSIVTISDLSSRLQAEHERIQNEKLLSVLELAGAVCHELNQPLMAISGYAELLMMNLDATHPHHGKLSKIIEQIKKTGDITRRLMSITKYDLVKHPDNPNLLDLKALKIPDLKS